MVLIATGKTKNVYRLENGNLMLKLKDDATGKDGVFDPGENSVGLTIEGLGLLSLKMSERYFKLMESAGIKTHLLESDYEMTAMTVKPAIVFGKGLEMICRLRAAGSFCRRFGDYIDFGDPLDSFFEVTLKNDSRQDPPITRDALIMLGIMTSAEYDFCRETTINAARIIAEDLAAKGLELFDIKLEYGKSDEGILLIDEISAGNMRAYYDNDFVQPIELARMVLES